MPSLLSSSLIDRRREERKSARSLVYLARPGRTTHRHKTRNLSSRGAFIEMDPTGLPMFTIVHLVFALDTGTVVHLRRLSALITRVSHDGIGVRF